MPAVLVRVRLQRLGEERQLARRRSSARPSSSCRSCPRRRSGRPGRSSAQLPALLADLLLADHHLHRAGMVAQLQEVDLAHVAAQHDAAGGTDLRGSFIQWRTRQLANLVDSLVIVKPATPRIETERGDSRRAFRLGSLSGRRGAAVETRLLQSARRAAGRGLWEQ